MRTIAYTVHEPPNPPADRIERAEQLEFVRDGFSLLAAVIPPLWLALNRLWLALLLYLLAAMALGLALGLLGVDKSLIGLINVAANIVIGFEASSLKRWTLGRRDWAEVGTVVGRNRGECERRFFNEWLKSQPVLRPSNTAVPSVNPRPANFLTRALAPAPGDAGPAFDGPSRGIGGGIGSGASGAPGSAQPRLWRRLLRR